MSGVVTTDLNNIGLQGKAEIQNPKSKIQNPISITVYMTTWCPDCVRSRRVLQRAEIPFQEIDIEKIRGTEAIMRSLNGDSGKVPTIVIETENGRFVLVEPNDHELGDVICNLIPNA